MWFGTDRGLVKFSGHEFEVFTTKNGLTSNTNYYLDESPDGRIWILGDDRRLTYFDHHRFTEFKYNRELASSVSNTAIPLFVDARGELPEVGYYCKPRRKPMTTSKVRASLTYPARETGVFIENREGEIKIHLKKELNAATLPLMYLEEGDTFVSSVTVNNNPFEGKPRAVAIGKTVYFSYKNQLYTYQKGHEKAELIANFPDGILDMEKDDHGNLYVGLNRKGLYKLEEAKPSKAVEFIPGISVTSIFIDRNDGLWISSLDNGIFFSQESKDLHYSLEDKGGFLKIDGNDRRIITLDYQNRLQEVKEDQLVVLDEGYDRDIRCTDLGEDGMIRLGSTGQEGRIIYDADMTRRSYEHNGFDHLLKMDSFYWCAHKTGLFRLSKDLKDTLGAGVSHRFPIHSLARIGSDSILLGSKGGVYLLIDNELSPYRHEIPFYRTDVVSILVSDDLLILSSHDQGIRIEKKKQLIVEMDEDDGLISQTINGAELMGDRLLVYANSGISVLEPEVGIRNFSRANGLISNAVNDAFYRNDSLWLATNRGISILSLSEKKAFDVNVYLSSFEVNGENRGLEESYFFKPHINTIEIHYEAPVYNVQAQVNYRYRLKGVDNDWVYTSNRSARYSSLPSGEFEFEIAIQNSNGAWGQATTLLTIYKEFPYYQRASFFLLMAVVLIGGTWLIIFFTFRRKNRRLKRAFHVMDLERRAVQAQMNPHFIFNAMTSLQNLILEQKKEDAVDFLVKFSRTTRMILNTSGEAFVPLDKELSLLKGYMDLELVRVDNKFRYTVELGIDDKQILVPPMLIQPFCENAIKHGLNPKEEEGELRIELFERDAESILCVVRDDGVGRGVVRTDHQSKGISLVEDRIQLLLDVEPVQIIDLKNEKGEAIGTEVRIIIPIKSSKNESVDSR